MTNVTKQLIGLAAMAAMAAFSLPASAASFGGTGPGTALQNVLDDITTAPVAGDSSVDVTTDYIADGADAYWEVGGAGGALSTVIIELASFANLNTFGVYDAADSTNTVELFNGAATTQSQQVLTILDDGSVFLGIPGVDTGVDFAANDFGFYLTSPDLGGRTWYSDSDLNSDGFDHLAVYEGGNGDTIKIGNLAAGEWSANEYILAWEDLDCADSCDGDYTDFVVIVESIAQVPEPSILALLSAGLIGLGVAARRRA